MTEDEWLACDDPQPMLANQRGKIGDRKLRLFAAACCRTIWHLLHRRVKKQIAIMENWVDGMASVEDVQNARERLLYNSHWCAKALKPSYSSLEAPYHAWFAISSVASPEHLSVGDCCERVVDARLAEDEEQTPSSIRAELAELLRDVLGNPFRAPPDITSWASWREGLAVAMARQMYESRDFSDLPVLADVLEDAGCDEAQLLSHGRGPGPHVRGCWAVDLLLAKG